MRELTRTTRPGTRSTHGAGLACVLTYTAEPDDRPIRKILLPGPGGTEDLDAPADPAPDAGQLRAWLTPIIGADRAAELAAAVDAAPPPTAAWR